MRVVPSEVMLVADDAVWLRDRDDRLEISDAFELRRTSNCWVDGLRGGRAGEICWVEERVGRGGGAIRSLSAGEGDCSRRGESVVRRGSGGGFGFALFGRGGIVGLFCGVGSPFVCTTGSV